MMIIFNYGIESLNKEGFVVPTNVSKHNNKINGGIWGSPKNEVYSDWFVLTLFVPQLVPKNQVVTGNLITIKDDAKILTLAKDNYKNYVLDGKLLFNNLKEFDVIHFSQSIMSCKEFEAYYFESYQILNFNSIEKVEKCNMDIDYIMSKEFMEKASKVFDTYLKHIKTTEIYRVLSNEI